MSPLAPNVRNRNPMANLSSAAVPRCTATESGGVRCELDADHEPGAHWISPETINARLYHRVTLIDPSAFTTKARQPGTPNTEDRP